MKTRFIVAIASLLLCVSLAHATDGGVSHERKTEKGALRLTVVPIHDDGHIPNHGYEYTLHNFGRTGSVEKPIWANNW